MTKKKTGVFKGAWMDGRVPEPVLRGRMAAYRREAINPEPVIAALSRQMELRRFWIDRQAVEPEPADWASLLRSVRVTDAPDFREVDVIRNQVHALPAHVIAVLNQALFERAGIGSVALFERMMRAATVGDGFAGPGDVALLRSVLADMIEGLQHVTGKRGPRYDVVPALRAVHRAIVENSAMADVAARTLAADLLNDCGIRAPTGRSRLAQIFSKSDPA